MVKKDRGRPTNPNARPKAYGEITVASDVPGLELLQEAMSSDDDAAETDVEDDDNDDVGDVDGGSSINGHDKDDVLNAPSEEEQEEEEQEHDFSEEDLVSSGSDDDDPLSDGDLLDDDSDNEDDDELGGEGGDLAKEGSAKREKRKLDDYIGKINAADASLRALKRMAMAKAEMSVEADPILSNEDFKRIREVKVFVQLCKTVLF